MRELRGEESQASFSSAIGIHRIQYAKYEAGKNAPSIEVLERICRVHACSADWLLGLPSRGGSATARGDGAIAAAGSNIHIEVGKDDKPGEMPSCKKCPHLKKLKELQKMIAK